jgi:hypothetical protein
MASAYEPDDQCLHDIGLRAIDSTGDNATGPFVSFLMGLSGLLLIVFPFMIWGAEELTPRVMVILIAMGVSILLAALNEAYADRSRPDGNR